MSTQHQLGESRAPWRPERSQIEVDLDLRTNVEVRAAYLMLRRSGMSQMEASMSLGRVPSWGSQIDAKPRPTIIRSTTAWINAELQTCACGRKQSKNGCNLRRGADQDGKYVCPDCRIVDHAERRLILIAEARSSGFVPTVRDAMRLLNTGRSVAAEELEQAFGPDPRSGSHRRSHPRPYRNEVSS